MINKGGIFFEKHAEKVVLVILGLLSIWLFITRVAMSPYSVEYGNKKYSPGKIDAEISKDAELLQKILTKKPDEKEPYSSCAGDFLARIDSAIGNIDVSVYLLNPSRVSTEMAMQRKFWLPEIGGVNEVAIECIRAAAYIPIQKVTLQTPYSETASEVNVIDLVTVEGKINISAIYKEFYESFAGPHVKAEWCDPCLAKPTFGAVELQRQELLADGSWSGWSIVPRASIEARKEMFTLIEDVNDLPAGGMKVRSLQFNNFWVQRELLQPEAYQIASAEENWLPPSLHKRFLKELADKNMQEKRALMMAQTEERQAGINKMRPKRVAAGYGETKRRSTSRADYGGGEYDDDESGGRRGSLGSERSLGQAKLRLARKEEKSRLARERKMSAPTEKSIQEEYIDTVLTQATDLSRKRDLLVFWAHDDTVEPEKKYRYRIRVGILNPIAGTNQFVEKDMARRNDVILWGEFSDTTETIDVPGRLYFFPLSVQETAKSVRVRVSKYVLGYWYSNDFTVKCGEDVGGVVTYEIEETQKGQAETVSTTPETINYFTGAFLLDFVPRSDWPVVGSSVLKKRYYDMLYSYDGNAIEHIAIKPSYWTKDLRETFNGIVKAEKLPRQPLQAWGSGISGLGSTSAKPRYEEYYEEEEDDYYEGD
ncbi:MAG: hypothetical protein ACYSSL_09875 [Planctomycetota bacterium]|jgi:hypothetical protein